MGRIEELSFSELVQELAGYEHDSGPPDLERAIRRRRVDARLMRLLSTHTPEAERRTTVRVPGDLPVKVYSGDKIVAGTIVDIGEGGVRVRLGEGGLDGDDVEIELLGVDPPPRATARAVWKKMVGSEVELGLQFFAQTDAHRRRMRNLIIELLRRMPEPATAAI